MSNKPVTPWNELEGRFFKVDVGSTTGDAITNDHQTGEPVVHYTTDGDIVFNGMKFCQQGGAKRFNKLIVHKAIPMTPEKGNFYYFYDGWIKFKVDLDRLDDSAVFRFPSVEGLDFDLDLEKVVAYTGYYGTNDKRGIITETIEGKSVAEVKKIIELSTGCKITDKHLLVRYIHESASSATIIKVTRFANLYDNSTIDGILKHIHCEQLHQFMIDNGCLLSSNSYEVRRGDYFNDNNRIDYCKSVKIGRDFEDFNTKWYENTGKFRYTKFYTYARRRKFYYKTENGKPKRYEVTRNGRKTYFRVRRRIPYSIELRKDKNFSFIAYARTYRKGKSKTYSSKEEKLIIWNNNGEVKIKKF